MHLLKEVTIQQQASKLSSRAASIAWFYTIGGASLCAAFGYAVDAIRGRYGAADNHAFVFLGFIAGGIGGFKVGTIRAFSLRLQAEIALCQLKLVDKPEQHG